MFSAFINFILKFSRTNRDNIYPAFVILYWKESTNKEYLLAYAGADIDTYDIWYPYIIHMGNSAKLRRLIYDGKSTKYILSYLYNVTCKDYDKNKCLFMSL